MVAKSIILIGLLSATSYDCVCLSIYQFVVTVFRNCSNSLQLEFKRPQIRSPESTTEEQSRADLRGRYERERKHTGNTLGQIYLLHFTFPVSSCPLLFSVTQWWVEAEDVAAYCISGQPFVSADFWLIEESNWKIGKRAGEWRMADGRWRMEVNFHYFHIIWNTFASSLQATFSVNSDFPGNQRGGGNCDLPVIFPPCSFHKWPVKEKKRGRGKGNVNRCKERKMRHDLMPWKHRLNAIIEFKKHK